VYSQSVKNRAFLFLMVQPPKIAVLDKNYFEFILKNVRQFLSWSDRLRGARRSSNVFVFPVFR